MPAAADSSTPIAALRHLLGADGRPVDLVETHISWVLLAGDMAWKIKKPLRLGFLDFSSLAQRKRDCDEELRLNRRFAPEIYLDVVPICGTPEAPRLPAGEGEDADDAAAGAPIEYALRMRRFPPRALFSERLADGRLTAADIDGLAARLAQLHDEAEVAAPDSAWGRPEDVVATAHTVLVALQASGTEVGDLQAWLTERMSATSPLPALMQARRLAGRVRECHGDLHLANAVVLESGATAFDCIEFDPALRWIDVQSDIAFLAMDLLAHGRADFGWRFVNAWLAASGDHAGLPLLRFFMACRAMVRALVVGMSAGVSASASAGLPSGPTGSAAEPKTPRTGAVPTRADYLALARRLAFEPASPRLLVTHGLSGSGKSWLTQALLERAGAIRLRSDVERKRLFGLRALEASTPGTAGDPGIYGPQATARTYARLTELARSLLQAGWPTIVDAACLHEAERAAFAALAAELGLPFTLLDCQASAPTLRERVRARLQRSDDASEADERVLAMQMGIDEPLTEDERRWALVVDTERAVDVAGLAARWLAAEAEPGSN